MNDKLHWPRVGLDNSEPRRDTYTIKNNEGISALASNLWIRESALKWLEEKSALRAGDTFEFTVDNKWNGMMVKSRILPNGAQNILMQYPVPKEAIYQGVEKDVSFPNIIYMRIPGENKYQILFKDTSVPAVEPIFVKTANLDAFRQELAKVSGAFITECASRKAQHDLMCSIQGIKDFPKSVRLNSNNPLDWLPTNIDLSRIVNLTDPKIDSVKMAGQLARSINLPA